jgi:aldose 1-epimerase
LGNNCYSLHASDPILEPVPFEEFRLRPSSYGIPILFPFPNRIRDGEFEFRGRRYALSPARHGFVRDKLWGIEASGASEAEGAWIRSVLDATSYGEEILKQFPFPFRVDVIYRILDGRLAMETTVRNTGSGDLPFGFGIHPYFRRPQSGTLRVPARKRWELAESLPTGRLLDVEGFYDLGRPRDLAGLVLDDVFTDLAPDADGIVRCVLEDGSAKTRLTVAFSPDEFPEVVVYTAPPPRQAIAIEPYTCPTDALNLHDRGIDAHLIVLEPGGAKSLRVSFEVSRIGS